VTCAEIGGSLQFSLSSFSFCGSFLIVMIFTGGNVDGFLNAGSLKNQFFFARIGLQLS
jgi:hypothetical protein